MTKKHITSLILLSALFPFFASAQTPTDLTGLVDLFLGYLNQLIPILVGLILLFFLYGVADFIRKSGKGDELAEAKKRLWWGIIAVFVSVAFWGLVTFLTSEFFGEDPDFRAPGINTDRISQLFGGELEGASNDSPDPFAGTVINQPSNSTVSPEANTSQNDGNESGNDPVAPEKSPEPPNPQDSNYISVDSLTSNLSKHNSFARAAIDNIENIALYWEYEDYRRQIMKEVKFDNGYTYSMSLVSENYGFDFNTDNKKNISYGLIYQNFGETDITNLQKFNNSGKDLLMEYISKSIITETVEAYNDNGFVVTSDMISETFRAVPSDIKLTAGTKKRITGEGFSFDGASMDAFSKPLNDIFGIQEVNVEKVLTSDESTGKSFFNDLLNKNFQERAKVYVKEYNLIDHVTSPSGTGDILKHKVTYDVTFAREN